MATAIQASSSPTFPGSIPARDAYSEPSAAHEYPYSHKRIDSNQHAVPRGPKTAPPRSPPPAVPTYDFQMDNVATPSPFKKRDRIPRTPDQYMAYHAQDWQSSRNHDPSPYRQMNVFKRHDALTPENSSEEDREVEETPIYLRSERFRQSFQDGRLTPSSPPDDEYDADSILGAYRGDMRYSFASDGADVSHDSPTPTESRPSEGPVNIQRISITRRDITPSKIPIYYASPKPIPMEYIFRSAPLHRSRSAHLPDLSDDPSSLKRVCSESLLDNPSAQLRSSPTRRKHSTLPRPRSRSLGSARPGLRGMKYSPSPNKRPPSAKGEPPWIQHSFSPNPSLPPEEQLIPTVAKRLEQERLEKEKGLVTVWDRQMRPLEGDRRMRESRVRTHKEADDMPTGNIPVDENAQPKNSFEEKTWPLNIDLKKAKREGLSVYPPSPPPISPGGPVRIDAHTLTTTLGPMQRFDAVKDRRKQNSDDVKKGCCCIVM